MSEKENEFPVHWPSEDASRLFWRHNRTHAPDPVSPLTGDFGARSLETGFNRAAESFDLPLRVRWARFNTYSYQAIIQLAGSTDEMVRLHGEAEKKLRPALAQLRQRWDDEWLPEIKAHHAFWDDFPLQQASLTELMAHLEQSIERFARIWEIHFLVGIPFLLGPSMFEDLYTDMFGADKRFEAYQLIEGSDNMTMRSERGLWELSRLARRVPAVDAIIRDSPAEAVLERLRAVAEARPFLDALAQYLQEFGARTSEFLEFADVSWREDPTPVVHCLQDYIVQPDRDRAAEAAEAASAREVKLDQLRAQMKGYPSKVKAEFEALFRAACAGSYLHSEHAYWIDQGCAYRMRVLFLAIGARLARLGHLESADDIVYLTLPQIREASLQHRNSKGIVEREKQQIEKYGKIAPPEVLGTLPTQMPPDTPIHRAIAKFVGGPTFRRASEPGEIVGNPASPGTAQGIARVVHELKDAGRFQAGDILVARTMAPPWAPLLACAHGIVTDTGGVLSHCAVIAREYNIPAVVGTGVATKMISDGQRIEVDGGRGLVRIQA